MASPVRRLGYAISGLILCLEAALTLALGEPIADVFAAPVSPILLAMIAALYAASGTLLTWLALRPAQVESWVSRPHEVLPGDVAPGFNSRTTRFSYPANVLLLVPALFIAAILIEYSAAPLFVSTDLGTPSSLRLVARGVAGVFLLLGAVQLVRCGLRSAQGGAS